MPLDEAKEEEMKKHTFEEGQVVFIRAVTHHYLGQVAEVLEDCVVLKKASWVADDGRFSKCVAGQFDDQAEVEVYPPEALVSVYYGGMIDSVIWPGELPTENK